jgi:hypothetical protein
MRVLIVPAHGTRLELNWQTGRRADWDLEGKSEKKRVKRVKKVGLRNCDVWTGTRANGFAGQFYRT